MHTRALKQSDIPILRQMAEASGFPYPDPLKLEAIRVVADDEDRPIMAAGAERLIQAYLWCGDFQRPHAKVFALRLLEEEMIAALRAKGYTSIEAYLPPTVEKQFSRRLERTFGFVRNWPSWNRRF
jgi:hypothetical protein